MISRKSRAHDRPLSDRPEERGRLDLNAPYEAKPLRIIPFGARGLCKALALVVPKRGGAVKTLLFSRTSNPSVLRALIRQVELEMNNLGKRKVYFVHPAEDRQIVEILMGCHYQIEGLLQEPYAPGQDALVLAKMLL